MGWGVRGFGSGMAGNRAKPALVELAHARARLLDGQGIVPISMHVGKERLSYLPPLGYFLMGTWVDGDAFYVNDL